MNYGALIRQLQGALGGRRMAGPYAAASGALAAGGNASVTVTHNLGTTDYYALGEPEDVFFGYSVSWIAVKSANSVDIRFRNNGGIANASLTINFFLFAK